MEGIPATTGIAGVRVGLAVRRGAGVGAVFGMCLAGVADEDGLLLDGMASLGAGGAGVDGMAVVEAATDGVALDHLDAHGGGRRREFKCSLERRRTGKNGTGQRRWKAK